MVPSLNLTRCGTLSQWSLSVVKDKVASAQQKPRVSAQWRHIHRKFYIFLTKAQSGIALHFISCLTFSFYIILWLYIRMLFVLLCYKSVTVINAFIIIIIMTKLSAEMEPGQWHWPDPTRPGTPVTRDPDWPGDQDWPGVLEVYRLIGLNWPIMAQYSPVGLLLKWNPARKLN